MVPICNPRARNVDQYRTGRRASNCPSTAVGSKSRLSGPICRRSPPFVLAPRSPLPCSAVPRAQFASSSGTVPSFINRVVDGTGPYRPAASAAPKSLFRSHSQGFLGTSSAFAVARSGYGGSTAPVAIRRRPPLRRRCSGRWPTPAQHASIWRPAEVSPLLRLNSGPASRGPVPDHRFGRPPVLRRPALPTVMAHDGVSGTSPIAGRPSVSSTGWSNNCPRLGSRIGCPPLAGAAGCLFAFGKSTRCPHERSRSAHRTAVGGLSKLWDRQSRQQD